MFLSPQNPYVEALTLSITVCGDGTCGVVIKVKRGLAGLDGMGVGCLHHAGHSRKAVCRGGDGWPAGDCSGPVPGAGLQPPENLSPLCGQESNALGVAASPPVSPFPTHLEEPEQGRRSEECEPRVYQNKGPAPLRGKSPGETFSWIRKQCFDLD